MNSTRRERSRLFYCNSPINPPFLYVCTKIEGRRSPVANGGDRLPSCCVPPMTLPTLLQLAKQGDSTAIAVLMSAALRDDKTRVECLIEGDCLVVTLRSLRPLNQHATIAFIRRGLLKLQPQGLRSVRAYAWLLAREFPVWVIEFPIRVESTASAVSFKETISPQTLPSQPAPPVHQPTPFPEPVPERMRLSEVDYREAELPIAVRESSQVGAAPARHKSARSARSTPVPPSRLSQPESSQPVSSVLPTSPQPLASASPAHPVPKTRVQTPGQELFKVGFVVVVAVMVYFVVTGV